MKPHRSTIGILLIFSMTAPDPGRAFEPAASKTSSFAISFITAQALVGPNGEFIQPLIEVPELGHLRSNLAAPVPETPEQELARLKVELNTNQRKREQLLADSNLAKVSTNEEFYLKRDLTWLQRELKKLRRVRDEIIHSVPWTPAESDRQNELLLGAMADCDRLSIQARETRHRLADLRLARLEKRRRIRQSLTEMGAEARVLRRRLQELKDTLALARAEAKSKRNPNDKDSRVLSPNVLARLRARFKKAVNEIGRTLRNYRSAHPATSSLSMPEFAKLAGLLSSADLRDYEFGKREIPPETAKRLAAIFGVDYAEFLVKPFDLGLESIPKELRKVLERRQKKVADQETQSTIPSPIQSESA